jgi:hypothetical protein
MILHCLALTHLHVGGPQLLFDLQHSHVHGCIIARWFNPSRGCRPWLGQRQQVAKLELLMVGLAAKQALVILFQLIDPLLQPG